MEKRLKVAITFIILVALIIVLYVFADWFSKVTGYFTGEDEKLKLAKCLSKKEAEFYGSAYCIDCEKQMALFGKAFSEIRYIDCGKEGIKSDKCKNLRSIPAWYINKKLYYRFMNFDELKKISGCE